MLTPVEERRFRAIETVLKLGGVSNATELVSEAKVIEAYVRASLSPDDGAVEPSPDGEEPIPYTYTIKEL